MTNGTRTFSDMAEDAEELELGSHQQPYGASHLSITHKYGVAAYSLDQNALDAIHDAFHNEDDRALLVQWLDAEACWNFEQELVELNRLRADADEWLQDHPEYATDPESPLLPGQKAW